MISEPRQNYNSASDSSGVSKALMVGLIVLAVAASILMLFFDSQLWLRIAVIAALWAAVLGLVLVSKYSSQLAAQRKRAHQVEESHRAQLTRAEESHRARELELEREYTQRLRSERDQHLEELRQELAAMRVQLAELTGEDLTEEQTALRARAERIIELEQPRPQGQRVQAGGSGQRPEPRTGGTQAPPAGVGERGGEESQRKVPGFSTGSFAAVRWGGGDADETSQIPLVVDTSNVPGRDGGRAGSANHRGPHRNGASQSGRQAPTANRFERGQQQPGGPASAGGHTPAGTAAPVGGAARGGSAPAQQAPAARPSAAQPTGSGFTAAGSAAPAGSGSSHHGHHERQTPEQFPPTGQYQPPEETHGRRRVDESPAGLTVAELMNRFKKNS
ncbi:DUF6779 domain-containing protein [Corynebacterium heidelbergense]|uniref:DUF6779 domain-containing protein n=1 Tax=Corynebacterium heidelbergense TaxID=2055947 RepID=A0A364VE80_9CORY|nr:DUF6779 domain-containing protein [Corynebacterium heidelbergense]RAV34955.1 hypothetical protein CWC39_00385 [Corynebacterium heidelbergense]WCZ35876.1 hypothetical protein CHEID_01490 [Corynebacterium heidelbergense]